MSQYDPWTLAIVYHIGTSRHVTPDTLHSWDLSYSPRPPCDYGAHLPLWGIGATTDPRVSAPRRLVVGWLSLFPSLELTLRMLTLFTSNFSFIPRLALLRSPSGILLGCTCACALASSSLLRTQSPFYQVRLHPLLRATNNTAQLSKEDFLSKCMAFFNSRRPYI